MTRRAPFQSQKTTSEAGFTIVELMIATLIFSVVLLLITVGVLAFSSSYYKGVNSSTTQTTAQGALDAIAQGIQFGASPSVGTGDATGNAFCAGGQIFVYSPGVEYKGGTPTHANAGLYETANPTPGSCDAASVTSFTSGTELLAPNMRVTDVSVSLEDASTNLWSVELALAYGDSDLLCNTSPAGGPTSTGACDKGAPNFAAGATVTGKDVECKSQAGSQFCSIADLTTTAQQRITGS